MATSVLPDRERRHLLQFYAVPRLSYGVRLGIAIIAIAAGLALQIFGEPTSIPRLIVGAIALLAGNVFLLVRGYNLQPTYGIQGGKWEKTTRDRFQAIRDLEKKVSRWDQTFADITCLAGSACLVILIAAIVALYMLLAAKVGTSYWPQVLAVDAAVLILPHWVTGTRRGWRPVGLRQQIDTLETAMREIERYPNPSCQIQPMLEVAGSGDTHTPIGARVFVRFPDGPEDFLGLQFQVALNEVQGTKYPYLYAVLVAKKSFDLLAKHFDAIRRGAHELLTIESSTEEDAEVIIIRQWTSGGSGYHTKAKDVRRIVQAAWDASSKAI